jgi:hypothetical protein
MTFFSAVLAELRFFLPPSCLSAISIHLGMLHGISSQLLVVHVELGAHELDGIISMYDWPS